MMQFNQNHPAPLLDLVGAATTSTGGGANPLHFSRSWPSSFSAAKSSLGSFASASSMEQLLIHCANAIENNDSTLAQQLLWVLNNIAPPDGDPNQRLTAAFLRALVARAAATGACKALAAVADIRRCEIRISALELANFIDITPWHRFGYTATNAAIAEAVEGYSAVHIVDLSMTHCMQIPTLIDTLASRPEGLQIIRLTVPAPTANSPPPKLDLSYEELGAKLVKFALSRNIAMEFRVVDSSPSDGFNSLIENLRIQRLISEGSSSEALIINCQMILHTIPEETISYTPSLCLRSMFLKALRSLEPTLVTLVDEDADFTSADVVGRLRSAFNYMWIHYDVTDALIPRKSDQREWYEAAVNWKIENVIAQEGLHRVERLESKGKLAQRMRMAGFRFSGFGDEAASEVKGMLEEHAAGWGMKKEEDDGLVLTWKGHNVIFATVWMPCTSSSSPSSSSPL